MESFDQFLKLLLHREPADFIGFGLRDPNVPILEPVPTVLPARGRDVDGGYRVAWAAPPPLTARKKNDDRRIAHVEFHRRHQSLEELAIDIAEAQVRLFRRERTQVISHVWDLYGDGEDPVFQQRTLSYGETSSSTYLRVNLRGMGSAELLAQAPVALWPLVPLTRDGASAPVIEQVRDAIEAHPTSSASERGEHLAVLRFVAEAEGLPAKLLQAVLTKERLMESKLYESILSEGRAEGRAAALAEDILTVLSARGIPVGDAVRARILGCTDAATLDLWIRRAAVASSAAAVVRAKASSRGGSRHRKAPAEAPRRA